MLIKLKLSFAGLLFKDWQCTNNFAPCQISVFSWNSIMRVTSGFFLLIFKSILLSVSQYSAKSENNSCSFVLLQVHDPVTEHWLRLDLQHAYTVACLQSKYLQMMVSFTSCFGNTFNVIKKKLHRSRLFSCCQGVWCAFLVQWPFLWPY